MVQLEFNLTTHVHQTCVSSIDFFEYLLVSP